MICFLFKMRMHIFVEIILHYKIFMDFYSFFMKLQRRVQILQIDS